MPSLISTGNIYELTNKLFYVGLQRQRDMNTDEHCSDNINLLLTLLKLSGQKYFVVIFLQQPACVSLTWFDFINQLKVNWI